MASPAELIEQLAAFHEDAFSWSVTCCGGDAEAGADTLQECYVKVMSARANFTNRSTLKTWWFGVIRLTALEQRRGQKRWQRMVDAFHDFISALSDDRQASTESHALAAPEPEQLAAALARLPCRQAEIVRLVFQHELSVTESAEVMGISVGSARQHYERAKRRLREELAAGSNQIPCEHAP